jgi:hypothetical protein
MEDTEEFVQDEEEEGAAAAGPKFAADGTILQAPKAPRSNLSLNGGLPPATGALGTAPIRKAPSQPLEIDPKALLKDGAKRAKNLSTALVMVMVLLAKFFLVKVVGGRFKVVYSKTVVIAGRLLQALYIVAQPKLEALKVQAKETTNKVVRIALLTLIAALTPLENATIAVVKNAKVHGAKLAAQGARTTMQVLQPIAAAFVQAMRAGFQKAVVQKLVLRLIHILEEAQK